MVGFRYRPPTRRAALASAAMLVAAAIGVWLEGALPSREATADTQPTALPDPQPPVTEGPPPVVPERVRVGLATDLPGVELPCCSGELIAETAEGPVATASSLWVEPAATPPQRGAYRVQAAALKDEGQAVELADRLRRLLGVEADVVFDAAIDLYRVRAGRYDDRLRAEAAQRALLGQGISGAFVVTDTTATELAGLRVRQGDSEAEVEGRWLAVRSADGRPIRLDDGTYRGRILVYLNDRGTLNLINEVSLDDYLRGVVPREMGPGIYDDLDALKAQTVAARSYVVRNLGEFAGEGYDVCATPRCQVYGGVGSEHPLSDRAVAETAGEVLTYDGVVADTLYTSTCGGHTENVEIVFPLKREPYLIGVPCLEAGLTEVAGTLAAGTDFPDGLTAVLLPPAGPREAPRMLSARLEHLALLAGVAPPTGELTSTDRRAVHALVGEMLELAEDSRLFLADEDVPYLLSAVPAGWSPDELRLAAYLTRLGLVPDDPARALDPGDVEELLFRLALYLRVVEEVEGRLVGLDDGALEIRTETSRERYEIGRDLGTFRRHEGRVGAGPVRLLPGDRVTVYARDGLLLGIVHDVDPDGVAYDRSSRLSSWTRFRSDSRLRELVATRYPGVAFAGLRLGRRGVSGRVAEMTVEGAAGEEVRVEGLAVRWTLDVPDTLFSARRLAPPDREPGWLFTGRGWGHGVGLCQVGAFGMGQRGHGYGEILRHYYSGVTLTRLETVPREEYDRLRAAGPVAAASPTP